MSYRLTLLLVLSIASLSVTPVAMGFAQREIAQATATSATPTRESDDEPIVLKLGSRGERVKDLQILLNRLGYYSGTGDGFFGENTKTAVIEFQRKMGLPVDGQVGEVTWNRVQSEAASLEIENEAESAEQFNLLQTQETPAAAAAVAIETSPAGMGWLKWLVGSLTIAAIGAGVVYARKHPALVSRLLQKKKIQSVPARSPSLKPPEEGTGEESRDSASRSTNGAIPVTAETHESQTVSIQAQESSLSETTRLPKIDITDELIKELHSPDPVKRRKAVWELGQRGDSKAVQPLVDQMIDADSSLRSLILASISEIGIRTLKPMNRALLISLQDDSSEVRKNAIRDVTRVYDLVAQISHLLSHATSDPDPEVQETARWALTQLNRIRPAPEIEAANRLPNAGSGNDRLPGDPSI